MEKNKIIKDDLRNSIKIEVDLFKNNIDQYMIEEKLGEGIFGTVKLATHKLTNEKVAIKLLNKNRITKAQQTLLSRELSILKRMNHFNIIKLYSIIETESIIYLIQEYSQGRELSHYIQNHSKIDEKEICKFFQQIISGIEYIHKMGIVHRDLKPENILLTRANDIKIIDFGLSNTYSEGELLKTSCGSPYYAPPEMLQGKPYKGLYSDIYSCGIILYYMLSKKLPFNEKNNTELYKKIIEGKFNMPKNISKDAQDLLKKIIKVNPEERIKIKDIKNHPWFQLANVNYNMHDGLNCDKIIFPIDNEIVGKMHELGFKKMEVRYNIIRNEHNNITTTYYLLLDKKIKKGRKSIADLHSNLFDDYINDPKNKIENYNEGIEGAIKERINSKGIIKTIPDFELERKRKRSTIIINNKGRKNSIKKDIRTASSGKENKDLREKIKMKIKMDILNKKEKEKNTAIVKNVKNPGNINKNRQVFSAKIKPKTNPIKKEVKKLITKTNEKENNKNETENNNNKNEKEEKEEKEENQKNKIDNKIEIKNNKDNNIDNIKKSDENKNIEITNQELNINDKNNKNSNNEDKNNEEKININEDKININEDKININEDKININEDKNIENKNSNKEAEPTEDKKNKTPEKINEEKNISPIAKINKPLTAKKNFNKNYSKLSKSNEKKLIKTRKKEVKKSIPIFKTEKKNRTLSSTISNQTKIKNKPLTLSTKKNIINKNKEKKNVSTSGISVKKNNNELKKNKIFPLNLLLIINNKHKLFI